MRFDHSTRATSPVAPPTTNRGAQNTGSVGLVALCDWLQFTDHADTPVDELLPWLDPAGWVQLDRGMMGYKQAIKQGHITILSDGQEGMGRHYIVSGQGCRELEAAGLLDWCDLLTRIRRVGGAITRLDLAIDDRVGVLDWETMRGALDRGEHVKRWKGWEPREPRGANNEVVGRTLYLGDRASEAFARIYDKALEQATKQPGEIEPTEHWLRFELQLRGERAEAMVDRILLATESVGAEIAGVILGYIDFKQPSEDTNKSRWRTASWWSAFLGGVAKLRLAVQPEARTIEQVEGWVRRQVAPSLALLARFYGDSVWGLAEIVRDGERRLRPRHLALLGVVGYGSTSDVAAGGVSVRALPA